MDKIDAYIPAGVGKGAEHEGETVQKNYNELHEKAGVTNKAFIEFNGKPMLSYIVETLDNAERIKSITIVGQSEETFPIEVSKPLHYIPGGESTYKSFMNAIDFYNSWDEVPELIMNVSSDVPLVNSEMIDKIVSAIDGNSNHDFYWNLILAEDVMKHYPEISKVPFKLKEANLRFGDLHVFAPGIISDPERQRILRGIVENRKSVWTNIKLISITGIIKYLIGRLSTDDLRKRVEKKFDVKTAMLLTEFPEPCIDLDYAKDLDKFKNWLENEPRIYEPDEDVKIMSTAEEFESYLEGRNYKKGEIPD